VIVPRVIVRKVVVRDLLYGDYSPGAACTTKRTTWPTFRPGRNLALRRANEKVGVYDDNVAHLVGTNAAHPSEVDLAG